VSFVNRLAIAAALMLCSLTAYAAKSAPAAPAPKPAEPKPATPEDLAFNRAQYEPAIRNAWNLEHEYDEFVAAELASPDCPPISTCRY
jgi:hypothetical protein